MFAHRLGFCQLAAVYTGDKVALELIIKTSASLHLSTPPRELSLSYRTDLLIYFAKQSSYRCALHDIAETSS